MRAVWPGRGEGSWICTLEPESQKQTHGTLTCMVSGPGAVLAPKCRELILGKWREKGESRGECCTTSEAWKWLSWERWKSLGSRIRRDLAGVLKVGMKKDQGFNQHGPENMAWGRQTESLFWKVQRSWILSKHSLISVETLRGCFQSSPMANFHAENDFTFATSLILLSHKSCMVHLEISNQLLVFL